MDYGKIPLIFSLRNPKSKQKYQFLKLISHQRTAFISMLLERYMEDRGIFDISKISFGQMQEILNEVADYQSKDPKSKKKDSNEENEFPQGNKNISNRPEFLLKEESSKKMGLPLYKEEIQRNIIGQEAEQNKEISLNEDLLGQLGAFY